MLAMDSSCLSIAGLALARSGLRRWLYLPLVVQGFVKPVAEIASFGQYGVIDHVARFEVSDGTIGYGLHEHGFFGRFAKYGMLDAYSGAPR